MPVTGLKNVLAKFDRAIDLFETWNQDQVSKATLKLHQEVKTLSSVEDQHTLKVLREMGHPYAVRHILPEKGNNIQGPRMTQDPHIGTEYVHRQTGRLLAALKEPKISGKERVEGIVEIDESQSPHARWVIFGTSKMIARNFPVKAMENIQDEWWSLLMSTGKDVVRNLKSQ